MFRRHFFKAAGLFGLANILPAGVSRAQDVSGSRDYWVTTLDRLAGPILTSLSENRLKERMPVESLGKNREIYTHLEAFGRLLAGIGPWLNLETGGNKRENELRIKYFSLSIKSIGNAVNPAAPDYMNFKEGGQPLVDAAFLACGLIRAPRLWAALNDTVKKQVSDAFVLTREIRPYRSNWLLFSAIIEAFFLKYGFSSDKMRLDYAISQHEQWYKGDGVYGDGPDFHWDYYNSYVIQPFLVDIMGVLQDGYYKNTAEKIIARAKRYAAVQERLIAPDGSFPVIGRSVVYRAGAFQHLANMALLQLLPAELKPSQVREALSAVIRKTNESPQNFDAGGWLRIGLNGHQPSLSETYISTGSLYLCSTVLLPLGLDATHDFWAGPALPWTAVKAWGGKDIPADHALG